MMRFALALMIEERVETSFPWGTITVNVVGCFAIGLFATVADEHRLLSPALRLFVIAGLLGGFTTFSTFGLETWRLVEDGLGRLALVNIAVSFGATLAAVIAGVVIGRNLS